MLTPFGLITVAAAGTPVQASSNLTLATGKAVPLQAILIQAHPDNTGIIYVMVGLKTPIDDRATLDFCVGILPAPASATEGPFPSISFGQPNAPASLDLRNFWIDSSASGNAVIVSGTLG